MNFFTVFKKEIATLLLVAFFYGFVFEAVAFTSRQTSSVFGNPTVFYIPTITEESEEVFWEETVSPQEDAAPASSEKSEVAMETMLESTEEYASVLYPADLSFGVIGRYQNQVFDAPEDNLFKVAIEEAIDWQASYELSYEVYGIGNASGVTKSINTNTSTGGFFIDKKEQWTRVTEFLAPQTLRTGENTILFTSDLKTKLGYQIRNLQIEKQNRGTVTFFHINDVVANEAFDTVYVQGVLNNEEEGDLYIEGEKVAVVNAYFEGVVSIATTNNDALFFEWRKGETVLERKSVSLSEVRTTSAVQSLSKPFDRFNFPVQYAQEEQFSLENIAITVPEQSYSKDFTLSIQELRTSDYAPTGMALKNVTKNQVAYRFLPDGITFEKEVAMRIKYDVKALPAGYSAKDIQVFYFDTQAKQWVKVKVLEVLEDTQEVIALSNHFTDYLAGVIQEPESPETNAFAPTTISGIQVANPTENIPMVSVPQINDRGDAVLNFPLLLLPARQGMVPDLSVNYNSGSDEGDFGLGWSLSVPTISVDTRWGVPVYDASKETESYLFNGEELLMVTSDGSMYVPHKAPLTARVSDAVFQKAQHEPSKLITREGNSPSNYTWKIEDSTTGWTYSYATYSKGKWYLKSVTDVFQNKMEYFYNQNATGDYQLQKIEYNKNTALFSTSDFTVHIYRKNTIDLPTIAPRKDVKINNRFGIESRSIQLIDKITVEAGPKTIKVEGWVREDVEIGAFYNEYHFIYKEGAFGRSLLQKIVNNNYNSTMNGIINSNTVPNVQEYVFDYHNDVGSGSLFESTPKSITTYKDYETDYENLGVHVSALGGGEGKSQSFSGGGSAGVVLPIFPDSWIPFSRSATIGGNFGGGSSNAESKVLMVDIDGDGLPDKVFKGGSSFYYRKNLGGSFSIEVYEIKKLPNLTYSKTDSSDKSFTVNILMGSLTKSYSSSVSTTSTYTADVNADGLLDVVDNERVYFGYIDPQTKKPSFNLDSSITPAIVIKEDDVAPILNPMPQLELTNGLMDVVMVWRAPKNGTVTISGTLSKAHVALQNGVKFSIEKLHETNMGVASFIDGPHLMLSSTYTHHQTQQVVKGDLLFFRVHSNQLPLEELGVTWNPRVAYSGPNLDPVMSSSRHESSYSDGFIVGTNYEQKFDKKGKYRLEWAPFNFYDADRVTVRVSYFKKNTDEGEGGNIPLIGNDLVVYEKTSGIGESGAFLSPNVILDMSSITSVPTSFHYVKVEVLSDSEIDWKSIDTAFKPKLVSLDDDNEDVYLIPYYSNYSRVHINNDPLHFTSNGTQFTVKINNNFTLPGCTEAVCKDRYIYLTAKGQGGSIITLFNSSSGNPVGYLKFRYKIAANGTVIQKQRLNENYIYINVGNENSYTTTSYSGSKQFFEYYSPDYTLAQKLDEYQRTGTNALIRMQGPTPYSNHANGVESSGRIQASIYSSEMNTAWGAMYRNWGQFAYKGNDPDQPYQPIVGNHIHVLNSAPITNSGETTEEFMSDTDRTLDDLELEIDEIEELAGNVSEYFGILMPNKELERWESHEHLYVSKTHISPYIRFITDEIPNLRPPTVPVQNYGAFGINKFSSFKNTTTNKSIGFMMVSAGITKTEGSSELLNDFTDINGDGFPDIIGTKIQLTAKRGGLSSKILNVNLNTTTKINGNGSLLGGSSAGIKGSAPMGGSFNDTFKSANLVVGSQGSGSLSGNSFNTTNEVERFYVDVNGDGLVDIVQSNGTVLLNYGGTFAVSSAWGVLPKQTSFTETKGAGAGGGFSAISNMDISLGISATSSTSKDRITFMDLNGDGLPEKIVNGTTYHLNTGTGFSSAGQSLPGTQTQRSTEAGLNGNVTICIYFPIPIIMTGPKFCFSVGGNLGRNYSSEEARYMDFDGDGFTDYVTSQRNESIQVYASRVKRTNLLKKVTQTTGATIELDYSVTNPIDKSPIGATYKMPFKKWALTKVAVYDDYREDGENTTRYAYEYFNGYKDRKERSFLGFGMTKAHLMDKNGQVYRTQQTEYLINRMTENELYSPGISSDLKQFIYKKGLVKSTSTFDKLRKLLNHTEYSYKFYDSSRITGDLNTTATSNAEATVFTEKMSVLPLVTAINSKEISYDRDMDNASFSFDTEQTFRLYDKKGNVKQYRDEDRKILVDIEYNLGVKTLPIVHSVQTFSGEQLRLTKAELAPNGVTYGKIHKFSDLTTHVTTTLEYNAMGNLVLKVFPGDLYYKYEYENTLTGTYPDQGFDGNYFKVVPSRISDSFGNVSETIVNPFGAPVRSRDVYGVEVTYVYDSFNRLLELKGPYESDWTIKNEFLSNRVAITKHQIEPGKILHTSMINDGLGRTIQVKKEMNTEEELELCNDAYPSFRFAVSGAIKYDEFGRVVENYLAEEEIVCDNSETLEDLLKTPYIPSLDTGKKIGRLYDHRDRVIEELVFGTNALTKTKYAFGKDYFDETQFTQEVTLPEGNKTVSYTNKLGLVTSQKQLGPAPLWTSYTYDRLGQVKDVKNAMNHVTSYDYDLVGRVLEKESAAAGATTYSYDDLGNLIKKKDGNGTVVKYEYHFNRLIGVDHPSINTKFSYDQGGRIVKMFDTTGMHLYKYGALGEVVEDTKMIEDALGTTRYFKTKYKYDSWGRILEMIYPDREHLFYTYNKVGQLKSIYNKAGTFYLREVRYTHFDQPHYIQYGNFVETRQEFDLTERLRATEFSAPNTNNLTDLNVFSRNVYRFDKNNNIRSVYNNFSQHEVVHVGGTSKKNYKYDAFNRLEFAKGFWEGKFEMHEYDLEMSYNDDHSIAEKVQNHTFKDLSTGLTTHSDHSLTRKYAYADASKPRVTTIDGDDHGTGVFSQDFNYLANGTISRILNSGVTAQNTFSDRKFTWDANDQITRIEDDGMYVNEYLYDGKGDRVVKRLTGGNSYSVNGSDPNNGLYGTSEILYPSGNLVYTERSFTKHYYANGKRLASSIEDSIGVDYFIDENYNNPEVSPHAGYRRSSSGTSASTQTQSSSNGSNPLLARGGMNLPDAPNYQTFDAPPVSNVCRSQIELLLQVLYNTAETVDCKLAILNILENHRTPSGYDYCAALEEINTLACIERTADGQIIDPETGYVYDPVTGLPHDPVTGLPIDLGTGGWAGYNWAFLDCLNALLNYLDYWREKEDRPYNYYELVWYAECYFSNKTHYEKPCYNLEGATFGEDGWLEIDFCDLDIPRLPSTGTPPIPEPNFPEDTLDTGVDDTWQDDAPQETIIVADPDDMESPIWWYHSDHLGSSSYITDILGKPVQYYEYLPFGEIMVQQSTNNIFENVYKFNGKELDEQTGYYYYGARYYDPGASIFLSVDPHAEKYPNINPYVYVANNPINAIDPDGRDIIILSYGAKRRGHKYGHLAMLIGDNDKGYTYFSLDGGRFSYQDKNGKQTEKPGYFMSKPNEYKSVDEFAQSEHNTFKDNYYDNKGFKTSERDKNGDLLQRYEKALNIATTEAQDAQMFEVAKEKTTKDYTHFFNWCTDNVNGAVEGGGLNGADSDSFWPNSYFNDIEAKNNGTRIDNKLKINDTQKENGSK